MIHKTRTRRTAHSRNARPLAAQLRRQAMGVKDDIREMGNTVKAAAQERIGELRDTALDSYEEGRVKAMGLGRTVQQYVEQQPLKSLLIAAGVGLVFGRFFGRR
jgi:ElaB/YqjD/DUF883 family membrane-anchored ribosome-binding protein